MLNWLHKSFRQLMLPHPRSFFSIFSWVGELLKLHRIHDKTHVCFSYIPLALPLIHLNLYPATLSFSWLLSNPYITIEIVQGLLSIEIDKMNIKNKESYNNLFTNFTQSEHIYPFKKIKNKKLFRNKFYKKMISRQKASNPSKPFWSKICIQNIKSR